jgi:O-antigen ligase
MNTLIEQAACNPESGAVSKIRAWSARATGWALVALGFALPLSTSGISILLGVILLLWIVSGDYRAKWEIMRRNPLAVASLILFGLYVLGLFHGKPSTRVIFDVSHFLLLALLIPLFDNARLRQHALWGFSSSAFLLLMLSYLTWLHLLPQVSYLDIKVGNNVVIQDRITYGLFVSVAAYYWAVEAVYSGSSRKRMILLGLSALAVFNLLGIVNSMTAYVILTTLVCYFLIRQWRWKGAIAFISVFVLLAAIAYSLPTSPLHQRVAEGVKEFRQWKPDEAQRTNQGARLEFYYNGLRVIGDHPFFGVGVGGFKEAYVKKIKDPDMLRSDNPHNEYLLVATQLGLIGLAALLYLFYTQWRLAPRLPTPRDALLARGVVLAFMVGCLPNSFLTDYHEGAFFIWISALLFSGLKPLTKNDNVSP